MPKSTAYIVVNTGYTSRLAERYGENETLDDAFNRTFDSELTPVFVKDERWGIRSGFQFYAFRGSTERELEALVPLTIKMEKKKLLNDGYLVIRLSGKSMERPFNTLANLIERVIGSGQPYEYCSCLAMNWMEEPLFVKTSSGTILVANFDCESG